MNSHVNEEGSPQLRTPAVLTYPAMAYRVFRNSGLEPLRGRKGIMLFLLTTLPIIIMVLGRIFSGDRGGGSIFFIMLIVPMYHYIDMSILLNLMKYI